MPIYGRKYIRARNATGTHFLGAKVYGRDATHCRLISGLKNDHYVKSPFTIDKGHENVRQLLKIETGVSRRDETRAPDKRAFASRVGAPVRLVRTERTTSLKNS